MPVFLSCHSVQGTYEDMSTACPWLAARCPATSCVSLDTFTSIVQNSCTSWCLHRLRPPTAGGRSDSVCALLCQVKEKTSLPWVCFFLRTVSWLCVCVCAFGGKPVLRGSLFLNVGLVFLDWLSSLIIYLELGFILVIPWTNQPPLNKHSIPFTFLEEASI